MYHAALPLCLDHHGCIFLDLLWIRFYSAGGDNPASVSPRMWEPLFISHWYECKWKRGGGVLSTSPPGTDVDLFLTDVVPRGKVYTRRQEESTIQKALDWLVTARAVTERSYCVQESPTVWDEWWLHCTSFSAHTRIRMCAEHEIDFQHNTLKQTVLQQSSIGVNFRGFITLKVHSTVTQWILYLMCLSWCVYRVVLFSVAVTWIIIVLYLTTVWHQKNFLKDS